MRPNAATRILAFTLPPLLAVFSRRNAARPSWNTGVSASTARSGSITAALRAGRRLPVACDLPVGQRRSWAIVVADPPRQGRAIAAPQDPEMDRAPVPKDAGTARPERGAGLPRARPPRF